jgi:dipeptidyl aminopeptidase/acylaminoacyl peptidase
VAQQERFSMSRSGLEIESMLLFPPDFDPSKKYPLVLNIHGGPHGLFANSFDITRQVLASRGYIVLAVNPRGTSTYGRDYMLPVLEDWGGQDYNDIMASIDLVCERPYVDSERLGVTGYSYGGYMSTWIVGHSDRFKSAVVGAPVTNLSSFYGTSDIGVHFGERQIGGPRYMIREEYDYRSPITYATRVSSPVLLLHGESDLRCPISQSEEYFVTLKRLGKVVEFVRFPGQNHGFLRTGHLKMRKEYLTRMLAWLDCYV